MGDDNNSGTTTQDTDDTDTKSNGRGATDNNKDGETTKRRTRG
jgi:hypothetical protein